MEHRAPMAMQKRAFIIHELEDVPMPKTSKLSVGQALEKLRGTEPQKSKMTRLDEKTDDLDKEIQRLRAERRRIERDQQRKK